jgi:hypothetical protein
MGEIYQLHFKSNGRVYFRVLVPGYYRTHFVCEPMAANWEPPPVEQVRKRLKPADFSLWSSTAPIVRERVCGVLDRLCGADIECLPFCTTIRGEQLFAINVLTTDNTRPLFKTSRSGCVYATQDFAVAARDNAFTGLALADPEAKNTRKLFYGEDINVFPGLPG